MRREHPQDGEAFLHASERFGSLRGWLGRAAAGGQDRGVVGLGEALLQPAAQIGPGPGANPVALRPGDDRTAQRRFRRLVSRAAM